VTTVGNTLNRVVKPTRWRESGAARTGRVASNRGVVRFVALQGLPSLARRVGAPVSWAKGKTDENSCSYRRTLKARDCVIRTFTTGVGQTMSLDPFGLPPTGCQ
jgi:hypothetical protein